MKFESSPLRVFVIYHPSDSVAKKELFTHLYEWFGGYQKSLHRSGLGIPVHPWTSTDPEKPPGEFSVSAEVINQQSDTIDRQSHVLHEPTMMIPIVDEEFAGRKEWREWLKNLEDLATKSNGLINLLPWALHSSAVHIGKIGSSQLLGTGACTPELFVRKVTEACSSFLLRDKYGDRSSFDISGSREVRNDKKILVFISYARKDGSKIALQVRSILQQYGHIDTFLDEHDIHPGESWKDRIHESIKNGAAMLAIVTDVYSTRPWCREELRKFREPRKNDDGTWWLPPVFVLDNLQEGANRSMFEIGNLPTARWNEYRTNMVIDLLVREILFGEVQKRQGKAFLNDSPSRALERRVINWVPDTWTMLTLQIKNRDKAQPPTGETGKRAVEIVYPGDGLPDFERIHLQEVFQSDFQLRSFEETRSALPDPGEENPSRGRVHFSFSDPPDCSLVNRGLSSCHLEDFVLRIGRLLLRLDFDIGYGGSPESDFTENLQADSGSVALRPRVINFVGWPFSESLSPKIIADRLGICRFVKIPMPDVNNQVGKYFKEISKPLRNQHPSSSYFDKHGRILSFSYTRKNFFDSGVRDINGKELDPCRALLVFGGQNENYKGIMPGVFEEVLEALIAPIPVYLFGGFGGAASKLADILLGKTDLNRVLEETLPAWENSEAAKVEGLKLLQKLRRCRTKDLFEKLRAMRNNKDPNNGLSWEDNEELMATLDASSAIKLLANNQTLLNEKALSE